MIEPNQMAAEIFLAVVRDKISARSAEKVKAKDLEGLGTRACEIADLFIDELNAYAKKMGRLVPPPPQSPSADQGKGTVSQLGPQPVPQEVVSQLTKQNWQQGAG